MRRPSIRTALAVTILAVLTLAVVGTVGVGLYEKYAYVPAETFVIAPSEIEGRIDLQVDGGSDARASAITIENVTFDATNVDRPIHLKSVVQRWSWLPGADHRVVRTDRP